LIPIDEGGVVRGKEGEVSAIISNGWKLNVNH
jgi:hypothetical protein